jgi:hypothetical protein
MRGEHAAALRACARTATIILIAATLLAGCTWFRRGHAAQGCSEPQVTTNIGNLPPLRVPPGMDPPDTRAGVHIPQLTDAAPARGRDQPCLTLPPAYGNPTATPGGFAPPARGGGAVPPPSPPAPN